MISVEHVNNIYGQKYTDDNEHLIDYSIMQDYDYKKLADEARDSNKVFLRIIDYQNIYKFIDFKFLEYFYWIISLSFNLNDSNFNKYYKDIVNISSLALTMNRKMDFSVLKEFNNLKSVCLVNQNINIINQLHSLEILNIAKNDCSKIDFNNIEKLTHLSIGSSKKLSGPELTPLKYLKTLHIDFERSLSDLSFLSDMQELEVITMLCVSKPVAFPDMSNCKKLKMISLNDVNRLKNFDGLQYAPNLTHIEISQIGLKPRDIEPLKNLPNLQKIYAFVGTGKNEEIAKKMFGDRWCSRMENWEHTLGT